ncbi:hypothetical protein AbraCBS73388_007268 [Aspergillus brasiliensis]|uniref:Uncharacterized protein n=1 Tax=Aspergillus brasiliensis TaxID=319629 RepID=A0A9W5YJ41_9EURO|nr:hypothetical protein AbraCBS73388_007268 [Aspergillus brasiliensis]
MNLTLILTLLATLVASIPADGPSSTDIYNPLCHKDSDCGTGCCYNGLCLAYCLHNKDGVHTELIRSLVDESLLPTAENEVDITAPTTQVQSAKLQWRRCCQKGLCVYCYGDKRDDTDIFDNVDADIDDDSDDAAPAVEMHKRYSMPDTDLLPTSTDIIHIEGMCIVLVVAASEMR